MIMLRFLADFKSAHDILVKVIDDKFLEAFYLARNGGEMRLSRIRAFVSATVSGGKYYTVREFIGYAEHNADDITATVTSGEDAVNVMTIHASKGLEFPVVIVCGLERKKNDRDKHDPILRDRDYVSTTKTKPNRTRLSGTFSTVNSTSER